MKLYELLSSSVQHQASDLHIAPGLPPRMRINGDLLVMKNAPIMCSEMTKKLIFSTFNANQQNIFAQKLEIDYAITLDKGLRFRVNAFQQLHGVAAVFRTIPDQIGTLDTLGMPAIMKQLLDLSQGLILVTGPTGAGKSSTLAAMVDHMNRTYSRHIITVEDPVEFIHASHTCLINQREVDRDTLDVNAALRSALRGDPDVILVGEMRDLETMRLALTAAETGHLVMATLHSPSAPRAVSRMIDVFPVGEKNMIRNMLSESLQAVICQRLVKKISGGRVCAFEIMIANPAIRNLIREDKIAQIISVMQTGREVGMCTLDQSLQELIAKKVISPGNIKEYNR